MRHMLNIVVVGAAASLAPLSGGCAKDHSHGGRHSHEGHHGYHEHSLDRMPAAVRSAVQRDYPAAQVVSAGSEFSDADESAHYHLKLRTADGQSVNVEYDASGRKLTH